jgi:hypothetical protein
LRLIVPSALARLALVFLATATLLGGSGRLHPGDSSDRTSVLRADGTWQACWAMVRPNEPSAGWRTALASGLGALPPDAGPTVRAPESSAVLLEDPPVRAHPSRERADGISARGPPAS